MSLFERVSILIIKLAKTDFKISNNFFLNKIIDNNKNWSFNTLWKEIREIFLHKFTK